MTQKPQSRITVGKIDAGIVNVGGQQTINGPVLQNIHSHLMDARQTVNASGPMDSKQKIEILTLIDQLKQELEKAPAEMAEQAEEVSKRMALFLSEANGKKPDKDVLKVTGESLKRAANNLVDVLPSVFVIATSIVQRMVL